MALCKCYSHKSAIKCRKQTAYCQKKWKALIKAIWQSWQMCTITYILVLEKGGDKVLLSDRSYRDGNEEELIEVPDRSFNFLKCNFCIRSLLTERDWVCYALLQNLCGFILWSILQTRCHQLTVTVHLDSFVFCHILEVRKGRLEAILKVSGSNIFLSPRLTRSTSV